MLRLTRLVLVAFLVSCPLAAGAYLRVDNLPTEATVGYALPIVRGTAHGNAVYVEVGGESRSWPVHDGRFIALVPLARGENRVTLTSGYEQIELRLRYQVPRDSHRVRVVWATASDGDGSFDAPRDMRNDERSAKRRLAFGARLLQSMVADRLAEGGVGRKTFIVDPEVKVWKTQLTTTEWWAMRDGNAMWDYLYAHLDELAPCSDCKTIVMLGMTHFDARTKEVAAHTALGGGDLALFGSGTLYAWPESLDDLAAALNDQRRPSELGLFDDSAYRDAFWANFATGLGAVLHEVGHALGLDHSAGELDIMNRGFDHVNRLLVASDGGDPVFDDGALAHLASHPWLAP